MFPINITKQKSIDLFIYDVKTTIESKLALLNLVLNRTNNNYTLTLILNEYYHFFLSPIYLQNLINIDTPGKIKKLQ